MGHAYTFGPHEVDVTRGVLRIHGAIVEIQPLPWRLLLHLLERPRQLVGRNELIDTLWPGQLAVSDGSLGQVVHRLRRVLVGDLLQTVPRRGYRLDVDPVHAQQASPAPRPDAASSTRPQRACPAPAWRDAFVGRAPAFEQLTEQLAASHLVSIVGFGGVGKTRFASEWVHAHHEAFDGHTHFCDLSDAWTADAIVHDVARTLGVPPGPMDPVEQLGTAIEARGPCLLVLDNIEQIADPLRPLLQEWSSAAPEARWLCTGRAPLHASEELVHVLDALSVEEACTLFAARARALRHDLVVPHDAALVRLVEVLDRLPLAIEMAAARVRTMSPARIANRLVDRFRLLREPHGVLPPRQSTLLATLHWSWELLSRHAREALAQLAVFESGFDMAAAEAVVVVADAWTPDLLLELVDQSLVQDRGNDRFELLQSVRAFALQQLDDMELRAAVTHRHGAHFAAWGTRDALRSLHRANGITSRAALLNDLPNVHEACRQAVARGEVDVAIPTLQATLQGHLLRGPVHRVKTLAHAVLAMPDLPARAEVQARIVLSDAHWHMGDSEGSMHTLEPALPLASADPEAEASVRRRLGAGHSLRGQPELARLHLERALTLLEPGKHDWSRARVTANLALTLPFEQAIATHHNALDLANGAGNVVGQAVTWGNLAGGYLRERRFTEAREAYERAAKLHAALGDARGTARVQANLGSVALDSESFDEAATCFQTALASLRSVADRRFEGIVLGNLGLLAFLQQRFDDGRTHFEAALRVHEACGAAGSQQRTWSNLGELERQAGNLGRAVHCFDRALALAREMGNAHDIGATLGQQATLYWDQQQVELAAEAWAEGARLLARAGADAHLAVLQLERAKAFRQLDPEAADRWISEGVSAAERLADPPSSELQALLDEVRARPPRQEGAG